MNTLLYNTLNSINRALASKTKQIILPQNKLINQLLHCFYQAKVIKFYKIIQLKTTQFNKRCSRVLIELHTAKIKSQFDSPVCKTISRPSQRIFIKSKDLYFTHKKLNKLQGSILILSTVHGILTHTQAIRYRCGGELVCIV